MGGICSKATVVNWITPTAEDDIKLDEPIDKIAEDTQTIESDKVKLDPHITQLLKKAIEHWSGNPQLIEPLFSLSAWQVLNEKTKAYYYLASYVYAAFVGNLGAVSYFGQQLSLHQLSLHQPLTPLDKMAAVEGFIPAVLHGETAVTAFMHNRHFRSLNEMAYYELLNRLLSTPESVDAVNHFGQTPLCIAVLEGNSLALRALFQFTPDLSKEYQGRTPYEWAEALQAYPMMTRLEEEARTRDRASQCERPEQAQQEIIWRFRTGAASIEITSQALEQISEQQALIAQVSPEEHPESIHFEIPAVLFQGPTMTTPRSRRLSRVEREQFGNLENQSEHNESLERANSAPPRSFWPFQFF